MKVLGMTVCHYFFSHKVNSTLKYFEHYKMNSKELKSKYQFSLFSQVPMAYEDAADRPTLATKRSSWRKSSTPTTIWLADEGSKWRTPSVSPSDKSKSGSRTEEWSSRRKSKPSRSWTSRRSKRKPRRPQYRRLKGTP